MEKEELLPGIIIVDLSLHLPKENVLIIADTHIGYEAALHEDGVLVPKFQLAEMLRKLENIFKKIGANQQNKLCQIIINGDIKHEFGKISHQEWSDTVKLLDFLSMYTDEIVLVKGNHDTILGPIARKRNVEIADYAIIDDVLVIHGHKIPKKIVKLKGIKTVVIGHEHPAVSFRERPHDKFKCFLKGKWRRKNLVVMPSFFLITEGADVTKEKLLSPFLREVKIQDFDVFVVGEIETTRVMYFGKLKDIK